MLILVLMTIGCLTTVSSASAQKKSIVIGLDGFGFGEQGFDATNTPRMDSLIDGTWAASYHGAYSDQAFAGGVFGAASQQPTVSGPGWTSLVTGVWANKHNVYNNSFTNPDVENYPAYLSTAKAANNSLTTASILWWQIYNDTIFDPINSDGDPNNNLDYQFVSAEVFGVDNDIAADTVEKLNMDGFNDVDADMTFVEFGDLDAVGHTYGSSGVEYGNEIIHQDMLIGQILDAITGRPSFAIEQWQVIVTSDHGHVAGGGHGGQSDLERRIPFIVSSQSLTQGILPLGVSQVDVAPTVLDHFDIAIPGNYDGVSRAAGGGCFGLGDFNQDCSLDATDWAQYRDGQHVDLSGLTQQQAYDRGDLNGDFSNNHADFVLFKTAFENANGLGSFSAMLVQIPESGTIVLALLAAILVIPQRVRTSIYIFR
jgi:hypothetical protein